MALTPFWGAAERSRSKVRGGCGSQKALKETGCSVAAGLMDLTETSRKQTWTLMTLKAPSMGMWGVYHSYISLKSLILGEGEELDTFSSSLNKSYLQEGRGEDSCPDLFGVQTEPGHVVLDCSLKCQSSVSLLVHPVADSFEKVIPSGQESGFR